MRGSRKVPRHRGQGGQEREPPGAMRIRQAHRREHDVRRDRKERRLGETQPPGTRRARMTRPHHRALVQRRKDLQESTSTGLPDAPCTARAIIPAKPLLFAGTLIHASLTMATAGFVPSTRGRLQDKLWISSAGADGQAYSPLPVLCSATARNYVSSADGALSRAGLLPGFRHNRAIPRFTSPALLSPERATERPVSENVLHDQKPHRRSDNLRRFATACAAPFYSPAPLVPTGTTKQQKFTVKRPRTGTPLPGTWPTSFRHAYLLDLGLFVQPTPDASAFERAFASQLTTALVDAGHSVSANA